MVVNTQRVKQLKNILTLPEQDAYYTVFNRTEYYPRANLVKTWLPKNPYGKMIDGTNEAKLKRGTLKRKNMNLVQESPIERSIRRTKREITKIVMANDFDLWGTLTLDPKKVNRFDMDESKKKLKNYLDTERRRGKFEYIIIPELDKGGAFHFHTLTKGYSGKLVEKHRSNGTQIISKDGKPVYKLATYTLGFSDFINIGNTPEDRLRVSLYVKKYMTKQTEIIFFGKKRYWASRGLTKPIVEENANWFTEKAVGMAQNSFGLKQGTIFEHTMDDVQSLKQQPAGRTFQHPLSEPQTA
jgi:hypothetical protein